MMNLLRSGFFLGLAIVMAAASGYASGPGTGGRRVRLDDYPAGPFLIRAVTSPTPPRVHDFNLEVRALNVETGEVVTGAEVTIRVEPVDHPGEPIEEIATHAYAPLPEEYAAHLPVETNGLWQVQITIVSPLGTGQAAFYQQIANTTALGAVLSVGAPIAGLLSLVLFFFWLQRNSGRAHTKR